MDAQKEIEKLEHDRRKDVTLHGTFHNWYTLYFKAISDIGDEAEYYLTSTIEVGTYDAKPMNKLAILAAIARSRSEREAGQRIWESRRSWFALGMSILALLSTSLNIERLFH